MRTPPPPTHDEPPDEGRWCAGYDCAMWICNGREYCSRCRADYDAGLKEDEMEFRKDGTP